MAARPACPTSRPACLPCRPGADDPLRVVPEARQKGRAGGAPERSCRRRARKVAPEARQKGRAGGAPEGRAGGAPEGRAGGAPEGRAGGAPEGRAGGAPERSCRRRARKVVPEARQKAERTPPFSGLPGRLRLIPPRLRV